MPRIAREKSATGIYHVMLRGINRQAIFEDNEDYEKFLQVIEGCKAVSHFELFSYCLMDNHVHLMIREKDEGIEQIFKRIGARYVYWYNWKYRRNGHLFQDRFKSEPVETDSYFVTVLRYIHQNPVKAGLCKNLQDYQWSSYRNYLGLEGLVDIQMGLDLIGDDYISFMNKKSDDACLELEPPPVRLTDNELREETKRLYKMDASAVQMEAKERRNEILKELLKIEGVSTRQLSRVTGVSVNAIWNL